MAQRRRQCANIKTTLTQGSVSAGSAAASLPENQRYCATLSECLAKAGC